jgi:hypothetical protein
MFSGFYDYIFVRIIISPWCVAAWSAHLIDQCLVKSIVCFNSLKPSGYYVYHLL